jgi:hypothetical protein
MYVPGDKYSVFYTYGRETLNGAVFDSWREAKAERNNLFNSDKTVRAVWIMKSNPSQDTIANLYGSPLRRTKYETTR